MKKSWTTFRQVVLAAFLLAVIVVPSLSSAEVLDYVVAVVNDDVITATELADGIGIAQQQIAESGSEAPPRDVLERQVLERLVMLNLQVRAAEQAGIQVDDQTLNSTLLDIARRNNLTLAELRQAIQADGYDFAKFREQIRRDILASRLRQRMVDSRVQVTDQEVADFLASRGANDDRQYHLRHMLIGVPEGSSPEVLIDARTKGEQILARISAGEDFATLAIQVSDAREALEGGDLGWRRSDEIPAAFADVVRSMSKGQVTDLIRGPTGFHILKLEDVRGAQAVVVQQTLARHILIRPNEVVSDDEARLRLQRLRDRIEGGADFGELARANSEDAASAIEGGDLGWASPGQFDPLFEQEMARLAAGQISPPFESSFGWHIVQVMERRQQDNSLDYERNQAREILLRQKAEEEWELYLRRLRDEAYVDYRIGV